MRHASVPQDVHKIGGGEGREQKAPTTARFARMARRESDCIDYLERKIKRLRSDEDESNESAFT